MGGGKWKGSVRRNELPKNWDSIRREVKNRAGGQCEWVMMYSMGRCQMPGTECDHRASRFDHSLPNLQWLCKVHHSSKTQAESMAAKRRKRLRPAEPHPGRITAGGRR